MASKKKGKHRVNTNRSNASWDNQKHVVFVNICLEEMHARNKPGQSLNKEGDQFKNNKGCDSNEVVIMPAATLTNACSITAGHPLLSFPISPFSPGIPPATGFSLHLSDSQPRACPMRGVITTTKNANNVLFFNWGNPSKSRRGQKFQPSRSMDAFGLTWKGNEGPWMLLGVSSVAAHADPLSHLIGHVSSICNQSVVGVTTYITFF
ncbi:hypothetical protein QJS10_CPA05g00006 [Acorus calamus]|uniref:Uncharacterized protein n=1 Tax=Acorus calamus TaxID=4465 RepID=A0AAV9EUQ6_ACOCL|nr:hypothetical protein QJS10_CPA05g00006 [Acorus calamus]